jgi:hypothetical protein
MRHCLLVLTLIVPAVEAAPQFSQSECQKLNAQRLEVRKQLRQPYDAEHGQKLQAQEKELLRLLKLHCKQPGKDEAIVVPALR